MLTLKRVHGLVGIVQNKRTLWRSMFWTLIVTRVVRARSYETIHLIGTHCVRTNRVYSCGNESALSHGSKMKFNTTTFGVYYQRRY